MQGTVFQLVAHASFLVKFVLAILLFFSVFSWSIIFYKYYALSAAASQSDTFVKAFTSHPDRKTLLQQADRLPHSPLANVFKSLSTESAGAPKDEMRLACKRYETREIEKLYVYLTFLATTGATTPFIGLLGTVWGIMNAFRGIGTAGSASLAVVAPGIAEALITTATGLAAAIPAVVAYNYYLSRARSMTVTMEDFSEELLAHFWKTAK